MGPRSISEIGEAQHPPELTAPGATPALLLFGALYFVFGDLSLGGIIWHYLEGGREVVEPKSSALSRPHLPKHLKAEHPNAGQNASVLSTAFHAQQNCAQHRDRHRAAPWGSPPRNPWLPISGSEACNGLHYQPGLREHSYSAFRLSKDRSGGAVLAPELSQGWPSLCQACISVSLLLNPASSTCLWQEPISTE